MSIQTQTIEYEDGDILLEGFLAYDKTLSTPRPAVLIAHPWQGRNQFVCDKAIAIAKSGYIGFALDMYGKGVLGKDADENAQLMQPFLDNRQRLQQRITAALKAVQQIKPADSQRIAAIGFCFGGLCVLDLARSGADLRGVTSFHGLLTAPENPFRKNIITKILILHGDNDLLAPMQDVINLQRELIAAKADYQIHIFGNTQHAFTNPVANNAAAGLMYKAESEQRAWRINLQFLAEIFEN